MSTGARAWVKPHESTKGTSPSQVNRINVPALARSPIDQITFLQTTIGNRGMGRLLGSRMMQAKLKVNKPGTSTNEKQTEFPTKSRLRRIPRSSAAHRLSSALPRNRSLKLLSPLPVWTTLWPAPANHLTRHSSGKWNSALGATCRRFACISARVRNNRRGM